MLSIYRNLARKLEKQVPAVDGLDMVRALSPTYGIRGEFGQFEEIPHNSDEPMRPTVESVTRKFKQLSEHDIRSNYVGWVLWYIEHCLPKPFTSSLQHFFQSYKLEVSSIDNQLQHIRNEILYLQALTDLRHSSRNISGFIIFVDLMENRCHADWLYRRFISRPCKQNLDNLTRYIARVQDWLATLVNNHETFPCPDRPCNEYGICCIKREHFYFKCYKKQFDAIMIGPVKRLVDTYLGLLPLGLDVWAVLFIVNQLPGFELLYDGFKVSIYERMRLFREKCSAKVTVK